MNNKIDYFGLDDLTQDELETLFNYYSFPVKITRNGVDGIIINDYFTTDRWFITTDDEGHLTKKRVRTPIVIGDDDDLFQSLIADAQQAENEKAIQALEEEEDMCDCCVKGWDKENEWGRCGCICSKCDRLLRDCKYKCLEEEPDTCEQCGRTDRLDHYWWSDAKKEHWIFCEDCGVKEQLKN
jgi:hypothetical protein